MAEKRVLIFKGLPMGPSETPQFPLKGPFNGSTMGFNVVFWCRLYCGSLEAFVGVLLGMGGYSILGQLPYWLGELPISFGGTLQVYNTIAPLPRMFF